VYTEMDFVFVSYGEKKERKRERRKIKYGLPPP
jgi:hypothetical protein